MILRGKPYEAEVSSSLCCRGSYFNRITSTLKCIKKRDKWVNLFYLLAVSLRCFSLLLLFAFKHCQDPTFQTLTLPSGKCCDGTCHSLYSWCICQRVFISLLPQVVMLLFWGDVCWSVYFSFFQNKHLHIKDLIWVNILYTSICYALPIETQNKNSIASKRFLFFSFNSIPFCFELWRMLRYSFL